MKSPVKRTERDLSGEAARRSARRRCRMLRLFLKRWVPFSIRSFRSGVRSDWIPSKRSGSISCWV